MMCERRADEPIRRSSHSRRHDNAELTPAVTPMATIRNVGTLLKELALLRRRSDSLRVTFYGPSASQTTFLMIKHSAMSAHRCIHMLRGWVLLRVATAAAEVHKQNAKRSQFDCNNLRA